MKMKTGAYLLGLLLLVGVVGLADAQDCPTLTQALNTTAPLSELYKLVSAAGLATTFNNPNLSVTVFAPDNAAVTSLSRVLTGAGLKIGDVTSPTNNVVASVILYHVATEALNSTQLSDGQKLSTLLGRNYTLTVDVNDNGTVDIESPVNAAMVVTANVRVCNSVVHIIDEVLLPAELASIPPYNVTPAPPGTPGVPPGAPVVLPPPPPPGAAFKPGSNLLMAAAGLFVASVFIL